MAVHASGDEAAEIVDDTTDLEEAPGMQDDGVVESDLHDLVLGALSNDPRIPTPLGGATCVVPSAASEGAAQQAELAVDAGDLKSLLRKATVALVIMTMLT